MGNDSSLKPFFTFWYRPSASIRALVADHRGHGFAVVLAGVFGAIQGWRIHSSGDGNLGAILLAAFLGIFALYLFGWLVRNFGRWFKAEAEVRAVRTALGMSLLPWALSFGFLVVAILADSSGEQLAKFYPLFFAGFLYGYVLILLSISAVLGISVWRGFFCLIITFLVSLFPLTLIAQLISGI